MRDREWEERGKYTNRERAISKDYCIVLFMIYYEKVSEQSHNSLSDISQL